MIKTGVFKRVTAGLLALIMVIMLAPVVSAIDADSVSDKVSDPSTMNDWQNWFGSAVTSTKNAGGVWTDKSVFTDAGAFPESVTLNDENNFLVALSALASNKTIVGYSNIPTDTMFVLDVSGSMEGSVDDLVDAANESIKRLFAVNNHNRIGVVLYSGSSSFGTSGTDTATVILPLDRYTAENISGDFLTYNSGVVSVASRVYGTKKSSAVTGSKTATGGTYIQNGLFKAYQEFEKVENTTIESGFQAGMQIMPIIVLMSDGAPTSATTDYANVGRSNAGTGAENGATTNMAFLTQLTASYVHAKIEEKYEKTPLFYTLGLNVSNSSSATSVLNPVGATSRNWENYKALTSNNTLSLVLPNTTGNDNPGYSTKNIYRNSYCTLEDYVDEYYTANNSSQMIESFQKIVDEIIIQSKYYPTNIMGSDPDFGGYITFEDQIGEYMEVKDIKGILVGDSLFGGAMLASQINSSSDGLGTVDNPTALGEEFIGAIKARLGISSTEEAETLAELAWEHRQLYYNSDDDYSNYIGWYAKADGSYHSFWHEGMTDHPADAVYINRSYGFLGKAEGNIKDSDMMYMSVQVHTNIKNRHQTVLWKIPAALVPVVTYKITLEGDSVENATDIEMEIENADPIRLVFEIGVRSDINELNVASVMAAADSKFKANDGYYFWTNRWKEGGSSNYSDTTTAVHFVPGHENERYYYVEDTDIYELIGGEYVPVKYKSASDFDANTDYYRMRTEFSLVSSFGKKANKTLVPEVIAAESLARKAQRDDGSWYIPRGVASHHFDDIVVFKASNPTESLDYSANPFVLHVGTGHEAEIYLGNNGRIKVTPAQGIMLSKALEAHEPGTSTVFKFTVELDAPSGVTLAKEYPYVIAKTGEYTGDTGVAAVKNGKIEITLSAGQTVFITDLPAGTRYTVTESNENQDYILKSISVNGIHSNNGVAEGEITAYVLDDVHFLNTPVTHGNLIVGKTVNHPFGSGYSVPEGLEFNVSVELEGENLGNRTFEIYTETGAKEIVSDANGVLNFTVKDGGSVSIHGIPAGTAYKVTETDIPDGFALSASSTGLNGVITAESNALANLVNSYTPDPVTPDVDVVVEKLLDGRSFKEGDSFEFILESYSDTTRASYVVIDKATAVAMDDVSDGILKTTLSLANERYTAVGTYHYVIAETDTSLGGNGIPGVSYDQTRLHFAVVVTDNDMDGHLEISDVIPTTPVSASKNESGYTVYGRFNNSYKANSPETVTVDITKLISSPTGAEMGKNGFSFTLYDEQGEVVARSNLTDVNGKAFIRMTFDANLIGESFTYVLKEDVHATPIPGMTYDASEKTFTVEIVDNYDGSVGTVIDGVETNSVSAEFTNVYEPDSAAVILSGVKNLSGRFVNENEFSFNLYETNSEFSLDGVTPIETVFAGYNRSFAFEMLTFDSVGTYYYVITETKGSLGGIEYDESVITAEITVKDVNGRLSASVVMKKDGQSVDSIEFNNLYTATPATVPLKGYKSLSGRILNEGEFEFALLDSQGATVETVKNDGNGAFAFTDLVFENAGRYAYTVSEVEGNLGGINYDKNVFDVVIDVTDNGMGALVYSVRYIKNNASTSEIVFVNSYSAEPVSVQFDGVKNLEGRELAEGEFEFVLTNTGNGTVVEKATNDANGGFAFSPITFQVADSYHYTVTETNNDVGGIDYDNTVYSIHIVVTDDGNGKLVAEVEYKNGDAAVESLEFNNSYSASPASVTLSGIKTLTGRDLIENEFSFELYETDSDYEIGDAEPTVAVNDVNGSFVFPTLTYETAGARYYVIVETDGGVKSITYDKTVYQVLVHVKDDQKGTLVAEVEIKSDGGDAETLVFANNYTALELDVEFDVTKYVENKSEKTITPQGFEFVLKLDGATVDKATSDENGKALLSVSFSEEDVGKTFTYYINEVNGGKSGVIYDTREYKIEITVEYGESGELIAKVLKDGNAENATSVEFVNVYEVIEPGDDSMFIAWIALLVISGGAAITLFANGKKKRRSF